MINPEKAKLYRTARMAGATRENRTETIKNFIASAKHHAWEKRGPVTIGGGEYDAAQLAEIAAALDGAGAAYAPKEAQFEIGQRFKMQRGKRDIRDAKIVDILRTYNSAGECVKLRYVAAYDFCGQRITDKDVCAVTIARALHEAGARS